MNVYASPIKHLTCEEFCTGRDLNDQVTRCECDSFDDHSLVAAERVAMGFDEMTNKWRISTTYMDRDFSQNETPTYMVEKSWVSLRTEDVQRFITFAVEEVL